MSTADMANNSNSKPQPLHLHERNSKSTPNSKENRGMAIGYLNTGNSKVRIPTPSPSPSPSPSAWALSPGRFRTPDVAVETMNAVRGNAKPQRGDGERLCDRKKARLEEEEDVHEVKMLMATYGQWRFVNARMEKAVGAIKSATEKKLLGTCVRLREMRNLVVAKRKLVQMARNQMKVHKILVPQILPLMMWEKMSDRTMNIIAESTTALQVSCTWLPFTDGAQTDLEDFQDAMYMALNVMMELQDMLAGFYNTWLWKQIGKTSTLLNELAEVLQLEMERMEELAVTVKTTVMLQMHEISLRANLVQLDKERSNGMRGLGDTRLVTSFISIYG